MRNTIALGQFELQLAEINSNVNSLNTIPQSELINQLPDLFHLYNKGKEIGSASFNKETETKGKALSKRIRNIVVPQLSESNSVQNFDHISNSIADSIPEAKAELDSIRTLGGGNNNPGIHALPVLPIVYGLIFLLGVARGAADGKKKKN